MKMSVDDVLLRVFIVTFGVLVADIIKIIIAILAEFNFYRDE